MNYRRFTAIAVLAQAGLLACSGESPPPDAAENPETSPVLEVTAIYDGATDQHLFMVSADTIPSGWTTIRFSNASPMLHFVFLDHLPGDRTGDDLLAEVSPVFQESMDLTLAGRPDEAQAVFGNLPEWFGELVFRGGPGFTSPGQVTEATLYLEPGNYVLECYVKTADGVFHWGRGMHSDLHVTADDSGIPEPTKPTLEVVLTDAGISIDGAVTAGEHLVAVRFQEENPGLFGKDLHVARLSEGGTAEDVVAWMDAMAPEGLVSTSSAPAPATFVGGVHDMPFGNTAYFRVLLEPGNYVWVSELPSATPAYQTVTVQ